ncbi:MAG: hypothetical protein AVDCRST_MAG30-3611, partial [uncultured Solirubrobacteraceae bacterium]
GQEPRLHGQGRQDLRGAARRRREQAEGGADRQRQGGRRQPVEQGRQVLEIRGQDEGRAHGQGQAGRHPGPLEDGQGRAGGRPAQQL